MEFDAYLSLRLQFAFVIAFQIRFPAFTICSAPDPAVSDDLCLSTGRRRSPAAFEAAGQLFAGLMIMVAAAAYGPRALFYWLRPSSCSAKDLIDL
jgi:hypothetical protein